MWNGSGHLVRLPCLLGAQSVVFLFVFVLFSFWSCEKSFAPTLHGSIRFWIVSMGRSDFYQTNETFACEFCWSFTTLVAHISASCCRPTFNCSTHSAHLCVVPAGLHSSVTGNSPDTRARPEVTPQTLVRKDSRPLVGWGWGSFSYTLVFLQ